jgi:hypothetical protein
LAEALFEGGVDCCAWTAALASMPRAITHTDRFIPAFLSITGLSNHLHASLEAAFAQQAPQKQGARFEHRRASQNARSIAACDEGSSRRRCFSMFPAHGRIL